MPARETSRQHAAVYAKLMPAGAVVRPMTEEEFWYNTGETEYERPNKLIELEVIGGFMWLYQDDPGFERDHTKHEFFFEESFAPNGGGAHLCITGLYPQQLVQWMVDMWNLNYQEQNGLKPKMSEIVAHRDNPHYWML